MFRSLLVLVDVVLLIIVAYAFLTIPGCDFHPKNTQPAVEKESKVANNDTPILVAPRELVWSYSSLSQVSADHAWMNQRVQMVLPPESYRVTNSEIQWFTGFPNSPPALVFVNPSVWPTLVDNSRQLTVCGICRGRVIDGSPRGSGITWCVRVTDCVIAVR